MRAHSHFIEFRLKTRQLSGVSRALSSRRIYQHRSRSKGARRAPLWRRSREKLREALLRSAQAPHPRAAEDLRVDQQDIGHGEEGGEPGAKLRHNRAIPLLDKEPSVQEVADAPETPSRASDAVFLHCDARNPRANDGRFPALSQPA
eukprot:scaffold744_cov240-Pinguiococcus_pyrenoidosus.AAC.5